ncbi:aminotransferase class I/II-fold pyridoxal phosphate-dependent enzyme [Marinoscillum furvescens]|uniref:8-amino-7-oxononanoate synthase n=1 Tax=Marinoscillum furvescens DSM 4134 TaxID=1122208 RepID=A0A3D9KXK3_MARFU|nr:8-amino-7-oxononanoate synthase [Marinoscillum furvescens]RED92457.1 8-amino-7-oxononanoate synthase [Marinoscillum furvescens DSM 4134]
METKDQCPLDFLKNQLYARQEQGNLRSLRSGAGLVDFVSNDYLSLSQNGELRERIAAEAASMRLANGGTGSRLLSGNYPLFEEVEDELKSVFEAEAALLFNSGYAANQALVSAVAGKGDTILYDQLAHVCLKEGAWLSRAATVAFRHNDLEDLEARLQRASGRCFVLTETVFSMDGDVAPLLAIIELCEQYGAYLIVDEAHSTGCYGAAGAGMLVAEGLADRVFARVYTFGKGMGVHGACVAGSQVLKDYLVNFGRLFIYTTSLPPHSVLSIREAFRFLRANENLQQELNDRIAAFQKLWPAFISDTAIQPIIIGSNERARSISSQLQEAGFDVRPVLSPTVQRGTERLRISLHTHNTKQELEALTSLLLKLVG